MNLRTFQAPTMAEALGQVKAVMGNDAVIVHARTLQLRRWLGLRRREVVEITAGRGSSVRVRAPRRVPIPEPVTAVAPATGNVAVVGLSQEVSQVKGMLSELLSELQRQKSPTIPEELFDSYKLLVENRVDEDLAGQIIRTLHQAVAPEQARDPAVVRERLLDLVTKIIPTSGPIARTRTTGPHVVALIGPTGVGKTTTIAKLSANLKLRDHQRVGLITIDTYRIAAIEQLRKYADILGAPLKVVASPEDLRGAVASMAQCDFVLIDTAGRSPNDAMKLSELKAFLSAGSVDEVHMVISATASQECIDLAISRFDDIGAARLIFTKLDEAAHAGLLLNVLRRVNKPVSYITTGQDVPDDIEVVCARRLAELIVRAR